jgi:hypothetical protein
MLVIFQILLGVWYHRKQKKEDALPDDLEAQLECAYNAQAWVERKNRIVRRQSVRDRAIKKVGTHPSVLIPAKPY